MNRMRMWQRIHDLGLMSFTEKSGPPDIPGLQAAIMTEAVCVDLQNVSDYIRSHTRNGGQVRIAPQEVDTFAQPFLVTWYEWRYVDTDYGVLALQAAPDENEWWIDLYVFMYKRSLIDEIIGSHDPRALCVGVERIVVNPGTYALVPGTPWSREFYVKGLHPAGQSAAEDLWREVMDRASGVFMFGMKFLHCRNVVLVDAPDARSRQQKRHDARHGFDLVKFKTLVIDPSLTRREADPRTPHDSWPEKALHIVRGNFAHYTDDKPLFGKYTGTFWRPAHVRGSEDAGKVFKDYRVKAGV